MDLLSLCIYVYYMVRTQEKKDTIASSKSTIYPIYVFVPENIRTSYGIAG